jgi:hypothetical protein
LCENRSRRGSAAGRAGAERLLGLERETAPEPAVLLEVDRHATDLGQQLFVDGDCEPVLGLNLVFVC